MTLQVKDLKEGESKQNDELHELKEKSKSLKTITASPQNLIIKNNSEKNTQHTNKNANSIAKHKKNVRSRSIKTHTQKTQ